MAVIPDEIIATCLPFSFFLLYQGAATPNLLCLLGPSGLMKGQAKAFGPSLGCSVLF
jgi:hypothetical protein